MMTSQKHTLRVVFFLVLSIATPSVLSAADSRSEEDIKRSIQANMSRIESAMQQGRQRGIDIEPARKIMLDEFREYIAAQKFEEAEATQQRVLDMLAGDSTQQDTTHQPSNQDLMRSIQSNMKAIDAGMQRKMEAGLDIGRERQILLDEFRPLMEARKLRDAEQVQQRVLAMLAETGAAPAEGDGPASVGDSAPDVSGFARNVDETKYLVITADPKELKGQKMPDAIFEVYSKRLRELKQGDERKWGVSVMLPSWSAPTTALRGYIEQSFDLAIEYDVALHFTIDSLEWEPRPDLWNYASPGEEGFSEDNANNVEWSDWDGTPFPHRFRDWGTPEKMAPVMCYNSEGLLNAVSEILQDGIAPALLAGMEKLEDAGKESLFAGVTVGSEPALPNYQGIERSNPRIAKLMDSLDVPKTRIGYCALTNLGYSQQNPPDDFAEALAEINRSYTEYWARELYEAGIPSAKMYTHVAAGAGVVGSLAIKHTNAPLDIAFTDYARPGWTTYPNGPLANSFSVLYEALAEHDNPPWGGTESNPQGLEQRGMPMDEYLDRHYDYGATLVVINIGATDEKMMSRLRDAVWGDEAISAYQAFLDGH